MQEKAWSIYIIKCKDGRLYTGISNDVEKRVRAHNRGKGCRFTKNRYPVRLVYQEECGTKSAAQKREIKIQRFTRSKKLSLINSMYKGSFAPTSRGEGSLLRSKSGRLAQSVRACASHAQGQWFEPTIAHHDLVLNSRE